MNQQTEQFQTYFNNLIAQRQLSHGYLFTGDDLPGKRAVVKSVGQALACPSFAEKGQACQNCEVCERISADQYPDILTIEPDGKSVRVDQIRELKDWLVKSPVEGLFKIAVIEAAESMNPSAANALLTFLEEPVANVHMFLLAKEAEQLLPTIRSRVQQIHFQPDDQAFIIEQLQNQGVTSAHAQIIARFSSETVERLVEDYDENDIQNWFLALNQFYNLLATGNRSAFVVIQSRLKPFLSVQQTLDSIDYLLMLNHSTVRQLTASNSTESPKVGIQAKFVQQLLAQHSLAITHLLNVNQTLFEVKQRVSANVSPQLAFERLAIKLCQWR
ncbi:hypothetical protein [Fundicoccus ignavus]|uniref:DNA polymerase III subunit delta n=1 Tax=Fundicoccus ignavus TaxID=2664442 RepID=A0A844BY45_9LACT|nr:hypothetical protein [Fundicoccus ignavus]MRJ46934.1 hypothetical protein [Fundicoccus ignavus]